MAYLQELYGTDARTTYLELFRRNKSLQNVQDFPEGFFDD